MFSAISRYSTTKTGKYVKELSPSKEYLKTSSFSMSLSKMRVAEVGQEMRVADQEMRVICCKMRVIWNKIRSLI